MEPEADRNGAKILEEPVSGVPAEAGEQPDGDSEREGDRAVEPEDNKPVADAPAAPAAAELIIILVSWNRFTIWKRPRW